MPAIFPFLLTGFISRYPKTIPTVTSPSRRASAGISGSTGNSCPIHMKPKTWLFTQQTNRYRPMDKQWLQQIILDRRKSLGLDARFCAHSLRHAYATHSYENGLDLLSPEVQAGPPLHQQYRGLRPPGFFFLKYGHKPL